MHRPQRPFAGAQQAQVFGVAIVEVALEARVECGHCAIVPPACDGARRLRSRRRMAVHLALPCQFGEHALHQGQALRLVRHHAVALVAEGFHPSAA
ncbi:MAG: hypothetical protein KDK08_25515, partial [Rhizobiaceae bacterium]|nr:hypothetical protein [Rhizobiaceae bacterium]